MVSSELTDCVVVSDLHLFSRRSRAESHFRELRIAVGRTRAVVLAGDIFDFKWSRLQGVEATVSAAQAWLQALLEDAGQADLHYVLGNHDHVPAHLEALERLAARDPRFRWYPDHLRLGNAVFLHGDVTHPRVSRARLSAYRERCARQRAPLPGSDRLYDLAVALRLHALGAKLAFPEEVVMRRLTRYLDDVGSELRSGTRNVYFGHTHLALRGAEHGGLRFHNCGAPIEGLDFRIVQADLS